MEEKGYIKIVPPADLTTLCGVWSDLDAGTVRKQIEDFRKEQRYIARSINFGLSYGMGAGGLQANLRENGIDIDK